MNLDSLSPLTEIVIREGIYIHRNLGPGLLESVYEKLLVNRLKKCGLNIDFQVPIPLHFDGEYLEMGFRADIIVNRLIILELKSVEKISPVHKKQLLTYLKISGLPLGLLMNFGDKLLKDGIIRVANSANQNTP